MNDEAAGAEACDLSFALRAEIAKALSAYLAKGEAARPRLHAATQRVCTEAHALSLTPEAVLDLLQRLFDRMPLAGDAEPARRRLAWQEFTKSCMSAYYNAAEAE